MPMAITRMPVCPPTADAEVTGGLSEEDRRAIVRRMLQDAGIARPAVFPGAAPARRAG